MGFKKRQPEGRDVDEAAIDIFGRVSGWGSRMAAARIDRIIGKELQPGMRVLDIGTGPATIPMEVGHRHAGLQMVGLDVSLPMLAKARQRCRRSGQAPELVAGDGEMLPFRDDAFDAVTSFFAVHHMDKPGLLLAEVDRVLKRNGILLIIDFRRDMAQALFRMINAAWQTAFYLSPARFGLRESVRSAYTAGECRQALARQGINRFEVYEKPIEIIMMRRV